MTDEEVVALLLQQPGVDFCEVIVPPDSAPIIRGMYSVGGVHDGPHKFYFSFIHPPGMTRELCLAALSDASKRHAHLEARHLRNTEGANE